MKNSKETALQEGGLNTMGLFKSSKEKQPLVTVVTSVLNGAETIEDTINSVLNQTYTNIEYIILDGGSKDSTVDILRKYSSKLDYWKSEPDKGIYFAWNKSIKIARGQWIAFIGSDDEFKLNAIEKMVNIANNSSIELDYISGKTELYKGGKVVAVEGEAWTWHKFRKYVCTGHNGALHNMNLYKKYGDYDTSFRSSADYELLLRPKNNLKTGYLDEVTTRMRLGGISNNSYFPIIETYLVLKKSGHLTQLNNFFRLIINLLKKTAKNIFKNNV